MLDIMDRCSYALICETRPESYNRRRIADAQVTRALPLKFIRTRILCVKNMHVYCVALCRESKISPLVEYGP